jgi:hypothetical protein
MKRGRLSLLLIPGLCLLSFAAQADDAYTLSIKNHRFEPVELKVPAGRRVELQIRNQDSSAEEFESYELNREKIVAGNQSATVYIGPLVAGRYPFFGDFNRDTARGTIVAQ